MRMRVLLAAMILLLGLTLACGPLSLGQQSAPTATPAPAQPTQPPAAATAAPLAPTATRPPAAATAAPTVAPTKPPLIDFGGLWSDAKKKATAASRYRMSMSWIIGATTEGVYKEQPFIVLEGYTVITDSYQVFTGGMFNEMLGGTKIEMMEVGGKSYMKGSSMFGIMDPNKWYIMSDTSASGPPLEPEDMFDMAGVDTSGLSAPKKTGSETVDGQSCDVWTWAFPNSATLLGFITDPNQASDLSVVDKSEARSWICADGYVHKMVMEITGYDKADVNAKGAMKMEARMWDFNNPALVITAPEGAIVFGQ